MEIPEMIGWISLRFVPSYVVLEVGSRQLAKKPSVNLRAEK